MREFEETVGGNPCAGLVGSARISFENIFAKISFSLLEYAGVFLISLSMCSQLSLSLSQCELLGLLGSREVLRLPNSPV